MLSFMLNMEPDKLYSPSEALLPALAVVLQGMATVFAVLCIIWLCMAIMRYIMGGIGSNEKPKETPKNAPSAPAPAPAPAPAATDAQLVAVIMAAIAAARADEGEGRFRVVSFTRKNK